MTLSSLQMRCIMLVLRNMTGFGLILRSLGLKLSISVTYRDERSEEQWLVSQF
jgi:hypothetical protein